MKKYKPTTKEELKRLVFTNNGIKLGDIDTSLITDMSDLFNKSERKDFDGIEEWDTSNVENMAYMFAYMDYNVLGQYSMTEFNSNLNNWNVSKVKNMIYMFACCTYFNQPLNKWDVSNVENMSGMFLGAKKFNQPLNNWNVSKVKDMSDMFHNCEAFNKPLDKWDVSNVKEIYELIADDKNKKVVRLKKDLKLIFHQSFHLLQMIIISKLQKKQKNMLKEITMLKNMIRNLSL